MQNEPREWQDFTQKAMDLAGLSQVELARILSKKLGREFNQSSVASRVKTPAGKAPKNEAEINAWADALKLDGQHRERFVRLALLERTPYPMRARLLQVEDLLIKAEKRIRLEEKRSAELRNTVDALAAELAQVTAQATSLMQKDFDT